MLHPGGLAGSLAMGKVNAITKANNNAVETHFNLVCPQMVVLHLRDGSKAVGFFTVERARGWRSWRGCLRVHARRERIGRGCGGGLGERCDEVAQHGGFNISSKSSKDGGLCREDSGRDRQ